MKTLITLEEAGQLLLGIILFSQLDYAWWYFPALLLLPDLSMAGYTINPKTGAWIYNFFHHKALSILIYGIGIALSSPVLLLSGVILFSHSAIDRVFGYGLKFENTFNNTHLGKIGNDKQNT